MYESVKRRKIYGANLPLLLWLVPCVLVTAMVVGLFAWAWKYQTDYRKFLTDFSNSTYHAYTHDSLLVQKDGESYSILTENVYPIYAGITSRGSGRVGKPPEEEPEAVLSYGDGSYMELWTVELKNSTNGLTHGLFVSYVNQEGERYSYDSDMLKIQILPIEASDNIRKVKELPIKE